MQVSSSQKRGKQGIAFCTGLHGEHWGKEKEEEMMSAWSLEGEGNQRVMCEKEKDGRRGRGFCWVHTCIGRLKKKKRQWHVSLGRRKDHVELGTIGEQRRKGKVVVTYWGSGGGGSSSGIVAKGRRDGRKWEGKGGGGGVGGKC